MAAADCSRRPDLRKMMVRQVWGNVPMRSFRFAPALVAGAVGFCGFAGTAVAASVVKIVEVPAAELAAHCAMAFDGVPAERVIACRGPDGQLYVPPMLSYNEQGFIYQSRHSIGSFCNRREAVSPVIPASANLPGASWAKPPISAENIACR